MIHRTHVPVWVVTLLVSCLFTTGHSETCNPINPEDSLCDQPEMTLKLGGLQTSCGQLVGGSDIVAVKSAPVSVKLPAADGSKKYMLLMLDPDAPFSDASRGLYWLHWLVFDIHGESLVQGIDVGGTTKMEYFPPNPPIGVHRYFFLMFEQSGTPELHITRRSQFNLFSFLKENTLCKNLVGYFMYKFEKE